MENVYEEGKKINLELNSEKLTETTVGKLSESKKAFKTKIEDSSKMLSELEARLFQSEKEKVILENY